MKKIAIYRCFKDLLPQYEALFMGASSASGLFLSIPWFRNVVATSFNHNTILKIYAIEDWCEDRKPCMALAMCYQRFSKGLLSPRRLMPVANYYTSLFSPIQQENTPESAENISMLAGAIAADFPRWDIVDLHPMDRAHPLFDSTQRAFRLAGMAVQSYFCFGNWYLEVNGRSYHEYLHSLSGKLRNTLQRRGKKLSDSNRIHFEIYSTADGLDNRILEFEKIYNSSWKTPEPCPAFIPGLIRTCVEEGWLRLGIAYVDNQAAAAQIWIVKDEIASIYKLAHDSKYANLSVGTLLTARLMQHVIDIDRVREVDFLTGDDAYKRDWMSHRRERWGIIAFNLHTFKGIAAAIINIGGRAIKNLFKVNRKPQFPRQ